MPQTEIEQLQKKLERFKTILESKHKGSADYDSIEAEIEVAKIEITIVKLNNLADSNSGATPSERLNAQAKVPQLRLKIREIRSKYTSTSSQPKPRVNLGGVKHSRSYSDFESKSYRQEPRNDSSDAMKLFMEYLKAEAEKRKRANNEDVKADFSSFQEPEEASRIFIGGVNPNEIKFYQYNLEIYAIKEMTEEFLNTHIAYLARQIADLEISKTKISDNVTVHKRLMYRLSCAKVMKSRLITERDLKHEENKTKRKWRQ